MRHIAQRVIECGGVSPCAHSKKKGKPIPVPASDTVILITRNGMGEAPPELQHKLIATYFKLLGENGELPAAICFYASAVHLAAAGSPVIEQLKALEARGVRLILCSTCVNYFDLAGQVQAGIIGSMADILEAQMRAGNFELVSAAGAILPGFQPGLRQIRDRWFWQGRAKRPG